jgi:hypothetical protein
VSAHIAAPLDEEDAWRVAHARTVALGLVMNALHLIDRRKLLPRHWEFVRYVCCKPVEHLSIAQRDHVLRLGWRYREHLPAHLAPKVNPADPIVREMEAQHAG